MTYDELSKILFCFGFDKGVRNIRQKQEMGYKINAFFEDKEDIDQMFLAVVMEKMNESLWSISINIEDKEQLESKLEKLLFHLRFTIHKFYDELHDIQFKI